MQQIQTPDDKTLESDDEDTTKGTTAADVHREKSIKSNRSDETNLEIENKTNKSNDKVDVYEENNVLLDESSMVTPAKSDSNEVKDENDTRVSRKSNVTSVPDSDRSTRYTDRGKLISKYNAIYKNKHR